MHKSVPVINIVTSLQEIRGNETHAQALLQLLRKTACNVQLWSDKPGPLVSQYGGTAINPFGGRIPRGGTLILLGTWLSLEPWIDHVRPERLIMICNTADAAQFFSMRGKLARPTLPELEIVYISRRLAGAIGIAGRVSPIVMDLAQFRPATSSPPENFVIGKLSRDHPEKHHPDDSSLYRCLAWQGSHIRIMGGTCLPIANEALPSVEILPIGAEPAADFLRTLSVFFYRTHPDWHEAAGRVVMEALASGLPVIAHTSGGYTDWIKHGENGFLFTQQEEALEYLTLLRDQPTLRISLSHAARAMAEEQSGHTACSEYAAWLCGEEFSTF